MPDHTSDWEGPCQCIGHVQGCLSTAEESQQDLKLAGEPKAEHQGVPGIGGAEAGGESQETTGCTSKTGGAS